MVQTSPLILAPENAGAIEMGDYFSTRSELYHVERVIGDFPRLQPMLDRLGGSLSGGEQQILAIARCLCGEPALIQCSLLTI